MVGVRVWALGCLLIWFSAPKRINRHKCVVKPIQLIEFKHVYGTRMRWDELHVQNSRAREIHSKPCPHILYDSTWTQMMETVPAMLFPNLLCRRFIRISPNPVRWCITSFKCVSIHSRTNTRTHTYMYTYTHILFNLGEHNSQFVWGTITTAPPLPFIFHNRIGACMKVLFFAK